VEEPEEPEESAEALEALIAALRGEVRRAVLTGDTRMAGALRRQLKEAERAWDRALEREVEEAEVEEADQSAAPNSEGGPASALLPLREQVHEALSVLQVPAAPRLIAMVHEAFFATTFPTARLTSLRRDEERSFRTAPSRGLLAISTWPMERRLIGSLSPRVDFLVSAINVAQAIEQVPQPVPAARALLARFAANVRGSSTAGLRAGVASGMDPHVVIRAAQAELEVHQDEDRRTRAEAATRAREQLDEAEQLFGSASFRVARRSAAAGEG